MHAISIVGLISNPSALGVADTALAFLSDGAIDLEEAGTAPGEVVSGCFHGRVYNLSMP